jgi:hypothetical protein
VLVEGLSGLAEWMAEEAGEDGALRISVREDGETWTLGGTELFTRTETAEESAWTLQLPCACYGEAITAEMSKRGLLSQSLSQV